jgi:glucokinase
MTLLVADVGGTNTRIALLHRGQISALERHQNTAFASFYDVLTGYANTHDLADLTGCCIAVAGPVALNRAKLTNRDWAFDADDIAAFLSNTMNRPKLQSGAVQSGAVQSGAVHLVNDMVALGYSLHRLSPSQLSLIKPPSGGGMTNNQALVVGMGTGFNLCLVKTTPSGPVVMEAEMGHACLPANVSNLLAKMLGSKRDEFSTIEHLLSGRGLSRLYRALSGGDELTGPQILAGYDPARDDAATRTIELTAQALGLVTRELVFQYLPFGGIYFAGGAVRGILGSPAKDVFLDAFSAPGPFSDHIGMVSIHLITDDTAALIGAGQYAQNMT